MTKPVIGSKYVPPVRSYERRGLDGSYTSFMEFPHGRFAERLQAALIQPSRPTLAAKLKEMFK